jgi:hypothetical protein
LLGREDSISGVGLNVFIDELKPVKKKRKESFFPLIAG